MSLEMYQETILDHYKYPRNFGVIDKASIKSKESNISCGDEVEMFLNINKNKINEVKFKGKGCAISLASTSILTESIKGKNINEIKKMDSDDLFKLINVQISPSRIRCALLGFSALKLGVNNYLNKK